MSISYRGVYLTPSTSDYQACRLSDISLYANHLYALFESSSYACPSNIALEISNEKISYEALSGKVNLCAAGFQALGAEQGDVIVFSLEKSVSLIVAMLAALKIGAKICVLPQTISALRLRAIQHAMPIAFLMNTSGLSLGQCDVSDAFVPRTVSYEQVMSAGLHGGSMTVDSHAFATAAQLIINYDSKKGLYPVEFPQSYFLKSISQLEDIFPASQPDQQIVTVAAVTQTKFLLDLFYAFSRQFTCVLSDKMNVIATLQEHSREIDIQGLQVSLSEIEYFARQYPGVAHATASISAEGLELIVCFSWDFYSALNSQRVTATDLISPKNDSERLACRLFYFLAQHLWDELPVKAIVLQPE